MPLFDQCGPSLSFFRRGICRDRTILSGWIGRCERRPANLLHLGDGRLWIVPHRGGIDLHFARYGIPFGVGTDFELERRTSAGVRPGRRCMSLLVSADFLVAFFEFTLLILLLHRQFV